MTRSKLDRYGNVGAFALVILLNYLATAVPLGGRTTGEISDGYFSMFTPTGFTFAIWGVIYLALFGFVIRQLMQREEGSQSLSQISGLFKLNCLANVGWILAWHYDQLEVSMVLMVVILWTLIKINAILNSDGSIVGAWNFVLLILPFNIYFGWISVASIANISILQSAYGLNDFLLSQQTWTVLKLGLALAAAFFFGRQKRNAAYLFVIAWAAFGISVANVNEPVVKIAALMLVLISVSLGVLAGLERIISGPQSKPYETSS
jgi:translocator protein